MPAQPALPPAVRATALGLLLDARESYRLARQHPDRAQDLIEEGDAYRAQARWVRAGNPHGTDRYGWPYFVLTPVQGIPTTL